MVHELTKYDFELPTIEDWLAGDNRTLQFQVVDGDGNAVDISTVTLRWALFDRPYQDADSDRVISGDDGDVTISTTDANGEWEVDIGGAATSDLWGEYTHRPEVEDSNGGVATWIGDVVLSA